MTSTDRRRMTAILGMLGSFVLGAILMGWVHGDFRGRVVPQTSISAACPPPNYMTNGTPDFDGAGTPTDDGLLRMMYRIAPTC
jgi:hypothetical protein